MNFNEWKNKEYFDKALLHVGHKVVLATYLDFLDNPQNVSVECEDCNEVIIDFEKEGKL